MNRFGVMLIVLGLLAGCARAPDEQRIREAIAAMQTAVAERAPKAFLSHVAEDFTGNQGDLDRDRLANAVGLNSASFNLARMIGPAVAGLLIAWMGEGVAATGYVISGRPALTPQLADSLIDTIFDAW